MARRDNPSNRDRIAMTLARSGSPRPVYIDIGNQIDRADEKHARQRIEFAANYGSKCVLRIDSRGGLCKPADAIARDLLSLRIPVEARVDNCCMSAAVRLFASATTRITSRSARFMIHRSGYNYEFNADRYTALELRDMADQRDGWDQGLLDFLQDRGVRLSQRWIDRFESGEDIYFNGINALLVGLATKIEATPEEQKRQLHTQWSAWRNSVIKKAAQDVVAHYRAQHSFGRVPARQAMLGQQRMVIV